MASRLFDLLVWALIFFPLLLGGVWVRTPKFRVELTELAVPVLLMSLLAGCLFQLRRPRRQYGCKGKHDLRHLSSVRTALKLGKKWKARVEAKPALTLWGGTFIWGSLMSLASLRRMAAHHSGPDTALFTNATWNLTHGGGYVSSLKGGIPLFLDHQSPILWLLAPLLHSGASLLVAQAFGLAAGGPALYYLGKQYLRPGALLSSLPWLYWAYLPMRNANAFDFHPEVWMLPLFLWAIAGLQGPRLRERIGGFAAFFLALACKESAGPVAVGLGLAWILGAGPKPTRSFTRKFGVAAVLLGAGVFLFDTKAVPAILGGTYAYDSTYAQFRGGLRGLLLAPFRQPALFFQHLFGKTRLKFLFFTLAPLGFVPLLGWRAVISSVPGYLMMFLSEGDHRVNPLYYYAIEPSVGLFWAFPLGLAWMENSQIPPQKLGFWLLFWSLVAFGRSETFRIRYESPSLRDRWISEEVLPSLDSRVPVSSSIGLTAELANRPWIQHLPNLEKGPGQVSCVVTDTQGNAWPMSRPEIEAWVQPGGRLATLDYAKIYDCEGLSIWQQRTENISCLTRMPQCPKQPTGQ